MAPPGIFSNWSSSTWRISSGERRIIVPGPSKCMSPMSPSGNPSNPITGSSPVTSFAVCRAAPRRYSTVTVSLGLSCEAYSTSRTPGSDSSSPCFMLSWVVSDLPLIRVMMSPLRIPALAAGPPGVTDWSVAPIESFSLARMSTLTPSRARRWVMMRTRSRTDSGPSPGQTYTRGLARGAGRGSCAARAMGRLAAANPVNRVNRTVMVSLSPGAEPHRPRTGHVHVNQGVQQPDALPPQAERLLLPNPLVHEIHQLELVVHLREPVLDGLGHDRRPAVGGPLLGVVVLDRALEPPRARDDAVE